MNFRFMRYDNCKNIVVSYGIEHGFLIHQRTKDLSMTNFRNVSHATDVSLPSNAPYAEHRTQTRLTTERGAYAYFAIGPTTLR